MPIIGTSEITKIDVQMTEPITDRCFYTTVVLTRNVSKKRANGYIRYELLLKSQYYPVSPSAEDNGSSIIVFIDCNEATFLR